MTNKKIPVLFAEYEEYEPIAWYSKQIGAITLPQVNKFLRILANTPRSVKCCTSHIMDAEYNRCSRITRGQDADAIHNRVNYLGNGVLELTNLFWDDSKLHCSDQSPKKSEIKKMNTCARMMQAGKCVDPLMRKLAAMMYPEKYKQDRDQR